jgi:hypothetical protein
VQPRREGRSAAVAIVAPVGVMVLFGCSFDTSGVGDRSTGSVATSSPTTTDDPTTAPTTTVDPTQGTSGSSTGADTSSTVDPSGSSGTGDTAGSSSTSDTGVVRGWWDADWPKRRRIDLALPENVAGPLSSVPVLILLDDQRIAFDELQANGEDLRFVDADDTTVLAHEIERWEPTGGTAVWVEIPEFTAVDSIFMYWGNPDAPAGDDPGALWSPGYAAVYHLDDNPEDDAPQIGDSSPSLRDATVQGGMTNDALVPGFATRGLAFDGMDDKALVGTIDSDAWTEITLSAWVFHGDEGDDRAISKAFGAGGSDHVFMLGAHSNDVKVRLRTDGDGAGTTEIRPAGSLPPNEWHYVAMTWSASTEEFVLFVDGNEVAREGRTGESLADANPDVYLANVDADENRHWLGTLDEIRIEYGVRDGDWFATQFAAMNDTLATFAAEEALP